MGKGIDELLAYIENAQIENPHLVIVIGNPGSGKSQVLRELSSRKKWDYVDCRSLVSDEIIELLPDMRAKKAPSIMIESLEQYNSDVILLDRVNTFFTPVLKLNPLELLRSLAKTYTIVAAWPGYFADGYLYFSRAGEAEPLKFDARDLMVWPVIPERSE